MSSFLGKAAVTISVADEGNAPPRANELTESVTNPSHAAPRAGLKRSRAQSNEFFDAGQTDTFKSIRKRRRISTPGSTSSPRRNSKSSRSHLSNDSSSSLSKFAQQLSPNSSSSGLLTTYPNLHYGVNGMPPEYSQLFIRPSTPEFLLMQQYSFDLYDPVKKYWKFVKDRRSTEAGKREARDLLEEGWRDLGYFQADLEDCARMTDTIYEFQALSKYFDVPYSGDDNVLTPNDTDYPDSLRGKSPPSDQSWPSWHGLQR
ncbi:hypothetical protein CPC08DRAFT_760799 [Agrocybe pediades]|nr:hypothetical protein CPC08DRAFT_760799 [Agrocybe pediades]